MNHHVNTLTTTKFQSGEKDGVCFRKSTNCCFVADYSVLQNYACPNTISSVTSLRFLFSCSNCFAASVYGDFEKNINQHSL